MSTPITGVFPVHNNIFKFGVGGLDSTEQQMLTPANLENFSPSFDNTIEEWFAMENEGWKSALLTGKGWTISFKGKRTIGDPANDYIAGLMLKVGRAACTKFRWILPDGLIIDQNVVIAVTNNGGGDTTNVGGLEFECKSDGKPAVTLPESETSTGSETDGTGTETTGGESTDGETTGDETTQNGGN